MVAWGSASMTLGQFQLVDVMRDFFSSALNGSAGINTLGNRALLVSAHIHGSIRVPTLTATGV